MTLITASALGSFLPLLLVLACPLMMVFMMRGMHGGRGDTHGSTTRKKSLAELTHERDQLDEEIGRRAEESVETRRATVFD